MSDPLTQHGLARFSEVANANVGDDEVPGMVALVARHDQVDVEVLGWLSIGGSSVQRDSLFRLASTTKPVTGAATLTLVREGLLTLDEPRDRLLPELANPRVLRRMDGIDNDVSLAPVDLLAGVVGTAVLADGIRTANRLRINDSGCRFSPCALRRCAPSHAKGCEGDRACRSHSVS